jgi:hypothetical protein
MNVVSVVLISGLSSINRAKAEEEGEKEKMKMKMKNDVLRE